MKRRYGVHWTYLGFMQPNVPRNIKTLYPNLCYVAHLYQKIYVEKTSIENLVIGSIATTVTGLSDLVKQINESDIYDIRTKPVTADLTDPVIREGLRLLKINADKFSTVLLERKAEQTSKSKKALYYLDDQGKLRFRILIEFSHSPNTSDLYSFPGP